MMLRKQTIACFAALLISLTAHGQTPQTSMKGYELYSWKIKGHWYYSLLPGTNRVKTYDEITASSAVRRDAAGLKSELQKLPKGEQVFWMSDAPAGASKSTAGQSLNVKHPSRKRIKGIKAMCDKLGIKLRLT
ncbi:MAG TPA: hypothetical protein VNO24_12425 [Blastocatellia bacterium]|nr:hypothetical protein [Blastocatellia bacterium]